MCRGQLGKLRPKIGELTAEGAAVLGVSIDTPEAAARLARDLGLTFPILADVSMDVIRAYQMKGEGMEMSDMGYVIIDKQGRIRVRQIDRRFGENVEMIVQALRQAKSQR
ncbi:MAG: peroxiredoxin family protein [Candidatus Rokubacteria bacterium]|nr:peroxiredoxin family protein [Candidatus Rokubacteria bacterium]